VINLKHFLVKQINDNFHDKKLTSLSFDSSLHSLTSDESEFALLVSLLVPEVGVGVAAGLGLGAFEVAGVALVLLVPVAASPTASPTLTGSTGLRIISGIE